MDPEDQGQDSEISFEENSQADEQVVEQPEQEEQQSGYNPVFEPIRQKLGLQFESILPDLREIDKGFHSGITKANAKYEPWKAFEDQGITPDQVTQSFGLLRQINDEPEKIYTALHDFLKQNGRLPETNAEVQQVVDDAEDNGDDDPEARIARLFEEREAMLQQQMEQFQMQQLQAQAEQDVDREYSAFEAAHPELSKEDKQEIYQRHFQYAASGPQNVRSLEEVAQEYTGLVNRIRSAPRPNDTAPRLPGSGGGVPTGQRKQMADLSREESQAALAALLDQGKQ